MSTPRLAGSPGPHVFVESLVAPVLADDDMAHLERSLRMRPGNPLTLSDAAGSWCTATYLGGGAVEASGEIEVIPSPTSRLTVAFALVKGAKPELVMQKLTEIGIDHIVVLAAERTIVKWDEAKVAKATDRWNRIVREAGMQSHRVRLPTVAGVVPAAEFLARSNACVAHFDGRPIEAGDEVVAIGPEGGWAPSELDLAGERVSLGETVLRAETAAICAGALLTAARRSTASDGR